MTDQPREKLCELIATYGQALCDDPRRCEALLRDLCEANRREVHVLVSALRERVAADLLAVSEEVPREVLRARLTQRLRDNLGLTEEIARWAVDSWALAIGRLSQTELSAVPANANTTSGPAPPATPSRRRRLVLGGLGVGVGFLAILIILRLNSTHQPSSPPNDSQVQAMKQTQSETEGQQTMVLQKLQGPKRSTPGVAMWRPYPFGQVGPVRYLESLIPAEFSDVWQIAPHVYCLGKQKKGWCLYSVQERAGTVSAITLPLGMAREKIDLDQHLVWLKLTEGRDGAEHLAGSPYTLEEVVSRLAEASRKLATSPRIHTSLTLGPHTFIFDRQNELLIVIDTDFLREVQKENEAR